ncbi:Nif3-like dinuclear metal center hexameric protein [Streptococcus merionis]|uniref:GTP cyclohydrolase 1 type 2 homolog n=1 Tax=Streptococcus merionis TaxID=400065 RepID=A0A239SSK6_9STRE|nr:Nif3-like dinuclear metal center hexameric protein [Streptococcus merionis]SNU88222.1 NIF3 (NGG1p interacting factor 3) family protein [Streptococcus merionis]
MKASEVIARYEAFCPQELSLPGDISGLQIGTLDKDIQTVMVALDVREATVAEAIAKHVDLIIVKHAPIFKPLKNLVTDTAQTKIYLDLIKHDIAVYVSHTNIDIVDGGLNDWFCDLLDIRETTYLSEVHEGQGIGRVGNISPQPLSDFVAKVKASFNLAGLRLISYDQDHSHLISRVAICGGSGDDFYADAIKAGADLYITGDIYYHTAQEMLTQGLLALDPGHHIEVLFVSKIAELLRKWQIEEGWVLQVLESQANTNPFQFVY